MIIPRLPREKSQINRAAFDAHRGDGQQRAILVSDEQQQLARTHQAVERHREVFGSRLTRAGDAIDNALPDGLLADGILRHLRHGERDLPGEQRLGSLDLNRGDGEIRRAQIQHQPAFARILHTLGNPDRHPLAGRGLGGGGMDARAGERDRLRALVVHHQPEPGMRTRRQGNLEPTGAIGLAEDRLILRERLPGVAIGGGLDTRGFDEACRRRFQRHEVEWLRQSGLQRDDGGVRLKRDLERFGLPNNRGDGSGALDHIGHFIVRSVVKPQILEARTA